jgi:hypothetical protein
LFGYPVTYGNGLFLAALSEIALRGALRQLIALGIAIPRGIGMTH